MEVIKQSISTRISERLEEGNNQDLEQFANDFVRVLYVKYLSTSLNEVRHVFLAGKNSKLQIKRLTSYKNQKKKRRKFQNGLIRNLHLLVEVVV